MDSKPYDVVLLPESRVAQEAIHLSKEIKQHGTYFTLGNEEYYPHISLYMLQLNAEGLNKSLVILNNLAEETDSIKGIVRGYHYEKGYFDVEYQASTDLISLQEKIIERLNPIRHGLRSKDEQRLKTSIGEEKDNIKRYGYRSVGNLFFPHLTFTRFKDSNLNSLNSLPPVTSFGGQFTSLAIFEMGERGTCKYKVSEWSLGL